MKPDPDRKVLSGASVFIVADVVKAAGYYRDAMGFTFDRFWGEPPAFCMVWRNEQCVMLSQVADTKLIRPVSTVVPEIWDAYFWVDDAEGFFDEMKTKGVKIVSEPTMKSYRVLEFTVEDLDGYKLAFGEGLDDG